MNALAQPDTRITEGSADKSRIEPTLVSERKLSGQESVKASLERSFASKDATPAVDTNSLSPLSNATSPLTFKPQLVHRDSTNASGLRHMFGIDFPLEPLFGNYYIPMRALGYMFQAQKDAGVNIFDTMLNKNGMQPSSGMRAFQTAETLVFTGLAGYYTFRECDKLFAHSKLALAAELGKAEEKVNIIDLLNTDNPIISTEASRSLWKALSRLGSAEGFLHSLNMGVLLTGINITLERSVFFQKTAYDMVSELVNDVQMNHLTGDAEKQDVINGLQRIIQRTTLDHNRFPINEEDLRALRPIFADIAQDIIDKKIGISSVIGYLGGGMIIAEEPERSQQNYEYVKTHGLAGIAAYGVSLRERQNIPANQPIWPRYTPVVKDETHEVAESAKRDKLIVERYNLDSRPAHLGSPVGGGR